MRFFTSSRKRALVRALLAAIALLLLLRVGAVADDPPGSPVRLRDEATGCRIPPEATPLVRTNRSGRGYSVLDNSACKRAKLLHDAEEKAKKAAEKAREAEDKARVDAVVNDFDEQYTVDADNDWANNGKISEGKYREITYESEIMLAASLQDMLTRRCQLRFPKTRTSTTHVATIHKTHCRIVFAATDTGIRRPVAAMPKVSERSPTPTLLDAAFAAPPADVAGPSNRAMQQTPTPDVSDHESDSEETASVSSSDSDMDVDDTELSNAEIMARADRVAAEAKLAYLASINRARNEQSGEHHEKATVRAAQRYVKERRKAFESSVFNQRYQVLRNALTSEGPLKPTLKKWTDLGYAEPEILNNFRADIVAKRDEQQDKGSDHYKKICKILKACKSHFGKLYCADPQCPYLATCVSIKDWVAFREDPEYKDALMYGCYSCADARYMFLGYCYNKTLLKRPIAYCANHVEKPCISFQDQENRTCMCCKSKDSAGNYKGNGSEPVYEYYTCTDCKALESAAMDATERKGIMENFYAEGLRLYTRIAMALMPGSSEIEVRQQKTYPVNKIDVSVHYIHPSKYEIVDLFEMNGTDHVLRDDLHKVLNIIQSAKKGVLYRVWLVRTCINDQPMMEICRQHWLRQHMLTARHSNGHEIPRVQLFLAGATIDNKRKLVKFFQENMEESANFIKYNVHMLTGVPAPVCADAGAKAAFACRDYVQHGRPVAGEFAPFQMIWDWSTMDQQYGATRQGVFRRESSGTFMLKPACTPLKLRKNMMKLPDTLDFDRMVHTPIFRTKEARKKD